MGFFSWTFAPTWLNVSPKKTERGFYICLQTPSSPKDRAKTFFLRQQREEHANVAQKHARCFISLLQTPLLLPNKDKVAKICVGVLLARLTVNVTGLIFARRRSITPPISLLSGLIWSSIMIRIMLKHFSPSYERGKKNIFQNFMVCTESLSSWLNYYQHIFTLIRSFHSLKPNSKHWDYWRLPYFFEGQFETLYVCADNYYYFLEFCSLCSIWYFMWLVKYSIHVSLGS